MQTTRGPSELRCLLTQLRSVHERMLADTIETRETGGTCLHAAVLVATAVASRLPGYTARIRGGDGASDGGFFDGNGRGYGHYWVEVTNRDLTWVADITGDQFGWEPVSLCPAREVAGVYVPGDQSLVDQHVAGFMETLSSEA